MADSLELRGKPRSVRRFNRRALIGLVGAASVIVLGAAAFALRSPDRSGGAAPQELYNTTMKALPDGLNEMPSTYADVKREPPLLGPPLPGDLGSAMIGKTREPVREDNPFRYEPARTRYSGSAPTNAQPSPEAQLADAARTSKLFFIAHQSGSAEQVAGLLAPSAPDQNRQERKEAFLGAEVETDIYNPYRLQQPISPYQVMAGTIIPASLVTGLNSDLPGQVIAQVTEHVYDTPTGQHLLIPQGSKLLGRYDSVIAYGQSRALVVWSRIIMPDGTSITIDNLPAVDMSGYAGLEDRVDHHSWQIFKAAILSSVLSVSSEIGRDRDDDILNALRDGGQQTINQAGQQIVTQQLQVQPTLKIRPGWRLRVIVNKDIVLQPYGGSQ
ncbi:MAG TPA: TrbI/VirB10 family protein [Henriciella marina]|uniref:TrbI/VirB10 family protein n=1 Tax=Henriciella sp. TaxID=1968823 RepID=UPI0018242993|nr:TrbI/VirB10 family protein [Henriciella sp.]HIG21813.1 TrbI/VirB10 family protein [Henriciella sp.]HIK64597.1 TrbI/VirB10 family protein [Henriciella marina]